MIVNCGAVVFQWKPMKTKTVCLGSPSATAEQLRQQLDNLHKEADHTRIKANSARLRLIRLSEAAEKLRRQAAVSVQAGKENDARDSLFQKKKVMQAMEKLKSRIELFDELSAKLNEAISMKENLLVGNMALDLEITLTDPPSPIRIVSPKEEYPNNSDDNQHLDLNNLKLEENQESQFFAESQEEIRDESFSKERLTDEDKIQVRKERSTYEDFMKDVDQQLNKIEEELEMFLRFSNLLLESKEKPEYSKVQQVMEILEGIRDTRERISTIMQRKMGSSEVPL
ncbi:hypothetical protein BUALT_Bualt03G0177700 [Buddleja alternifolia]|uniref:Uncharacterized protein n=1 Tax=Buddleja alternifolia TaxID=168488 RepID=A0AAV6XVM0_9LAMI|nr:hypothetical protein BUALT_Bualt03G0177700 [Buddleja alternifolia]